MTAGALGLRLWGIHHGLPYVYNVDEQAHFVPRAIGFFGHDYDPHYFVNPPALTYLLHVVFAVWFGGGAGVSRAYAHDPSTVFAVARATSAVLGAASVALLCLAGARLAGRRAGLLAGGLLAVAFLPVFYGHLALNDGPALLGVCVTLVGAGGVLRYGRRGDHLVAGLGVGLAAATKYTAGIVVLCWLAATLLGPGERSRDLGLLRAPARAATGLALGLGAALATFLVCNPYAALDVHAFWHGMRRQAHATGGVEKLGVRERGGYRFYLRAATWGLGWAPALAALGGALALAARGRDRRLAAVLVPAPVVFLAFMGSQDRYFGRWLLPIVPILCLLAAVGGVRLVAALAARRATPPVWLAPGLLAVLAAGLAAQGLVHSVHVDRLLSRPDTRALTLAWMRAHVPPGARVVLEPVTADGWLADPAPGARLGGGDRWTDVLARDLPAGDRRRGGLNRRLPQQGSIGHRPLTRLRRSSGVIGGEGYQRTLHPGLIDVYERERACWVISGSTSSGRAFAEPRRVPRAIAYYAALRRRARVAYRATPLASAAARVAFDFDFSFDGYPLDYARFGPEMTVYRLTGGRCAPGRPARAPGGAGRAVSWDRPPA